MGAMKKLNRIDRIEDLSQRLQRDSGDLRKYHDAVGQLSVTERKDYRGKILAVLTETGNIIAVASNKTELCESVAATRFADCPWRIFDGPTSDTPTTTSSLAEDTGNSQ